MKVEDWPGIGYWDFSLAEPDTFQEVPTWANDIYEVFARHESAVRSTLVALKSDEVLAEIASDLRTLGYQVESGKSSKVTIRAGRNVPLHVDAFHPSLGVVREVEAVRAQLGGAFYRDIFRTLLIGEGRHGAIAVPMHGTQGNRRSNAFAYCYRQLSALPATGHRMPFGGLLLLGY